MTSEPQDLRPCWLWEAVPGVPEVGVLRNQDGAVVEVWERTADDAVRVYPPGEMHPAEKGAYLPAPGETDVPGRVY